MKKTVVILMCFMLVLLFCSCAKSEKKPEYKPEGSSSTVQDDFTSSDGSLVADKEVPGVGGVTVEIEVGGGNNSSSSKVEGGTSSRAESSAPSSSSQPTSTSSAVSSSSTPSESSSSVTTTSSNPDEGFTPGYH